MTTSEYAQKVVELIDTRPRRIDFDKLLYEIYVRAKIAESRRAQKEGRWITNDEMRERLWSPYRCPRAPDELSCRHLIIKKYRIIFEIDEPNRAVWIRAVMFPYQYNPAPAWSSSGISS